MHVDTAHRHYSTAKGYVQSSILLLISPERFTQLSNDSTIFLSFHMLCGFAVELYLKAILFYRGLTPDTIEKMTAKQSQLTLERQIIDIFGHDLKKLKESVDIFLNFEDFDYLIEILHQRHNSFEYRYTLKTSSYPTPDLNRFVAALNLLDFSVGGCIRVPNASMGHWILTEQQKNWRL